MKQAIISLFLVLSVGSVVAQFEHPDLVSGKKHVQNVMLLPVVADITKVSMKGPEPMIEESRRVEKELAPVIAYALRKKGLNVDSTTLTVEGLANDDELKYIVDDLQKQYDQQMGLMMKKSKDVRKGRFTLGEAVMKLPLDDKVDGLLFVRAQGQVLTGGKKAFSWLMTVPETDVVQVSLGVVDAKTGEVLYFAKPMMAKNMAKNPESLHSGIEKSFKNFAKANASTSAGTATEPIGTASATKAPGPAVVTSEASAKTETTTASVSTAVPNTATLPVVEPPADSNNSTLPATTISTETAITPVVESKPVSRVYVLVYRTERHIKYSDNEVFKSAVKQITDYLEKKEIAYTGETPGVIVQSQFELPMNEVLSSAKSARAQSVLVVSIDRPLTKWIEFKTKCFDVSGKELWTVKGGSGGGFSGEHGLKVGFEHLQTELDPHVGQTGLPLRQGEMQSADGK